MSRALFCLRHPLPLRGGEGKGEEVVSLASKFMERAELFQGVAADVSRRYLVRDKNAPTNVGGYTLSAAPAYGY
ncbi:MAG: hypothetical protein WCK27_21670 [Verrucomicrobiota bacterium]